MDGKIGMFVNAVDGYHGHVVDEVQEAAARERLAVDVFDADHSAAKQAQDVVRFHYQNLGTRLCVFVIPEADAIGERRLDDDPTFHLAQRMLQKEVGWITLNHGRQEFVAALREQFPGLPTALVEIDNLDFGRVQGQQVKALVPKGGTVVCIHGNPQDTACVDRTRGLKQELDETAYPLFELDGHWSDEAADRVFRKWIKSPLRRTTPVHIVVCQNDQMAAAARKALVSIADELRRPELKAVPVLGGDGLPQIGRPWVDQGTLAGTVAVKLPGATAVEQLARFWRDGTPIPAVTRLGVSSYPDLAALRRRPS